MAMFLLLGGNMDGQYSVLEAGVWLGVLELRILLTRTGREHLSDQI
jgi:hypothetical protein